MRETYLSVMDLTAMFKFYVVWREALREGGVMKKTPSAGYRESGHTFFRRSRWISESAQSGTSTASTPSRQMLCTPSKSQLAENNSDGRGCQLFIASLGYYLHALFEH